MGARTWVAEAGDIFRTVDWWVPPYFQGGHLRELARTIEKTPEPEKHRVLESALGEMYGPAYLGPMLTERYAKVPPISEFATPIREAIEASAFGLPHAAVATLLTVVEGVLRKGAAADGRDLGSGTKQLAGELERFAEEERARFPGGTPNEGGQELIDTIGQLATYVRERLLKQTSAYAGVGELNRHGILHGVFTGYGAEYNFHKLISFLDALTFVLSWKVGVSVFAPRATAASKRFTLYLHGLIAARRLRPLP